MKENACFLESLTPWIETKNRFELARGLRPEVVVRIGETESDGREAPVSWLMRNLPVSVVGRSQTQMLSGQLILAKGWAKQGETSRAISWWRMLLNQLVHLTLSRGQDR